MEKQSIILLNMNCIKYTRGQYKTWKKKKNLTNGKSKNTILLTDKKFFLQTIKMYYPSLSSPYFRKYQYPCPVIDCGNQISLNFRKMNLRSLCILRRSPLPPPLLQISLFALMHSLCISHTFSLPSLLLRNNNTFPGRNNSCILRLRNHLTIHHNFDHLKYDVKY